MPAPVVTPQRTQQSPIKLFSETSYYAPELKPIVFQYSKASGTLEDDAFVLDRADPGPHVVFDAMKCPLRKLHFHAPGEHRIDGRIADLELHLVHEILQYPEAYPSAYLIIGVMLAPKQRAGGGQPVQALDAWLRDHLDATARPTPARAGGARAYEVDPSLYLPPIQEYFRYEGSLTSGDFDEFVTWVVLRDPAEIAGPGPVKLDPKDNRIVQPLMRRYVLRNFALIA